MTEEQIDKESYKFQAEIRQLLNILANSLYTDREIFLRELISNASDALHRIQFEMLTNRDVLDPEAELAIHVEVDEEAKTITVSDTGIGMTRDEMITNLGTIAHSGVGAFLQGLSDGKTPAEDIIGQFGVGFYSVFMVADEVQVLSRAYQPDSEAFLWTSSAGDSYTISPAGKKERGTKVIVKFKEDAGEFANKWKLEQIIKKHSNYIPFPIYLGKQEMNQKTALWRQMPSQVEEEKYDEFYRQLTLDFEKPLVHIHINTDAPVQVYTLLFIPSKRDRGPFSMRTDYGLKLYTKKVLIQEYAKDLLPNYFRFVEGVVDTEELPLNISRETVQTSRAMERVRKVLESRLLKEFNRMAEEEPETYAKFWNEHGVFIKEGITTDFLSREKLMPLVRFHTSKSGSDQLASLADYIGRMAEDQEAIYYILGEDLISVASSPHLDYFRDKDIEVIYMVDPLDSLMMGSLDEYEGKPFKSVDDPKLELPGKDKEAEQEPVLPSKEFDRLKERCVDVLGSKITQVRETHVLKDSPCRLVAPDDAPSQGMQRVYRLMNKDYEVPKKILELNRRHPLIKNLAKLVAEQPKDPLINIAIEQLYENGLLIEGIHPNPAAMAPRIQSLLEKAVANSSLIEPSSDS